MLVIRLTRSGKTSQESFRMVVAEQSKAVKRQYIELVGHYVPTSNPKILKFNQERISYWISQGAQPSETVASLLKGAGVAGMEKYIKFQPNKKAAKKKVGDEPAAGATPEVKVATPAPATEEAPVAESPAKEDSATEGSAPTEAPVEAPQA